MHKYLSPIFLVFLTITTLVLADEMVLQDGSKVQGELLLFPDLVYQNFSISLKKGTLASIEKIGSKGKYITVSGEVYIAPLSNNPFVVEVEKTQGNVKTLERVNLNVQKITFSSSSTKPQRVKATHVITFKDGEMLPVILPADLVTFSDGYEEKKVPLSSLIHLSLDPLAEHDVKTSEGTLPLPFAFVREKGFTAKEAESGKDIFLLWEFILQVEKLERKGA